MRAVDALRLSAEAPGIDGPLLPGIIWGRVPGCAAWPRIRDRRIRHRGWRALGLTVGVAAARMAPPVPRGVHAALVWPLVLAQYRAATASGWPMPDALSTRHLDRLEALWSKVANAPSAVAGLQGEAWLRRLALHADADRVSAAVALPALFAAPREGTALSGWIERRCRRTFGQAAVAAVATGARAIRAGSRSIALVSIAKAVPACVRPTP